MARIRTIKPEFWTSEQVVECSPNARLLFIGMWNFSDDNGIHPASCKRLKMEVFPADQFAESDIEAMVAELLAARLIEHYVVAGTGYWVITGWAKHQKIDKPTAKHPLPDQANKLANSPTPRLGLAEPSPTPLVRKGMESNGKEEKGGGASPSKPDVAIPLGNDQACKPSDGKGKARGGETLKTFLDRCKTEGVKPLTPADSVFDYAETVGVSKQMVGLAWDAFKAQFLTGSKLQKDWRAHFRNAVRCNWYRLWYISGEQGAVAQLTTAGQQALRAQEAIALEMAA